MEWSNVYSPKQLGAFLKKRRKERGISQDQYAEMIGVSVCARERQVSLFDHDVQGDRFFGTEPRGGSENRAYEGGACEGCRGARG